MANENKSDAQKEVDGLTGWSVLLLLIGGTLAGVLIGASFTAAFAGGLLGLGLGCGLRGIALSSSQ